MGPQILRRPPLTPLPIKPMTFGDPTVDPTVLTALVEQDPFSCLDDGAIGALHPACPPPLLIPPTGELLFLGATDEDPPAGSGYDGDGLASSCNGAEALTIEVAWECQADELTGVPLPAEGLDNFGGELPPEEHSLLLEPALFMDASPWQLEDGFTGDGEADGTVDPQPQLAVCWEYPDSTIEEGIPPVPSDGPHPMGEPALDAGVAFSAVEELLDLSSEMATTTWLPDETQDSSSEAIGGPEDEAEEPQLEISRPFISMPWWRCATPQADEPIDGAKTSPLDDSAKEPQFWLMEATMTAVPATDPAIGLASDWAQDGTSEIIDSPEDEIKDLEVAETSQPDLFRPLVPMAWWRSAPLQADEPAASADPSLVDDSQENIISSSDLGSDAVDLAPIPDVLGSDDQPEPVALKGSVREQVATVAADAEPLSPDVVPVPDSAADIMSLSEVGTTGVQAPDNWRDLDPSQLPRLGSIAASAFS